MQWPQSQDDRTFRSGSCQVLGVFRLSRETPDDRDTGFEAELYRDMLIGTHRMTTITYQTEASLSAGDFVDVLMRSMLAERRPVGDIACIQSMLKNADVIVTARSGESLVGVSRAITDFAYCTYLSDLAVDEAFQRRGIGRELIRRTHQAAGLQTTLILLASPRARSYYGHIGMTQHDSCWTEQPST